MAFSLKSTAAFVFTTLCVGTLYAEPPTVSYIFPAGGQRGQKVEVRVGGHFLHEECPWEMAGSGILASPTLKRTETIWFEGPVIPLPDSQQKEDYPKDQAGTVTIQPDAELGVRYWRAWTSQGITPAMKFVVGSLPEIVEAEVDGEPIPQQVQLPVTINGRIFPREDVDVWSVDLQAGETVTCEVVAERIGSPLQSRLEVLDPNGSRIAEDVGALGIDSRLRFTAEVAGVYQIRIHDIDFGGLQHYVYRLTITDGAYVDRVYPLGGCRGTKTAFQLAGQGVPAEPVEWQLPEAGETAALALTTGQGESNPSLLDLDDLPEFLEESAGEAPLPLPAVANGRISQPGETDAWRVTGTKGMAVELEIRAARFGSPLDSVLTIANADGKELARADDLANGQTDSRLQFTFPEDGVYEVRVAERISTRGGPEFAYRLRMAPAPLPDFRLTLPGDVLTLLRGNKSNVKLACERSGGFDGEIAISIDGLPEGVTLSGDKIAEKKNDTQLTFEASPTARVDIYRLQIRGTAMIGEQQVVRTASLAANPGEAVPQDFALAIGMPTPFKFQGIFETKYAPRGAVFTRHYTLDRGGYAGPLEIDLADRQFRHLQGVNGSKITVPADADEFDYSIYLPPWMEIGRTSRTILSAVGIVKDEEGREHKVAYTSGDQADQIIILVDPGSLSVDVDRRTMLAEPGETVRLTITVGRTPEIKQLPARVELILPEHVRGVSAPVLELPAGASEGMLELTFDGDQPGPFNAPLLIRATCPTAAGRYVAETRLTVIAPESAAVAP